MKNNKNIFLFLIVLLIIPALACSSTLTEPMPARIGASVTTETAIAAPTPHGPIVPTRTASPAMCKVTADVLHLRDAPNVAGYVMAWLEQGDQLTILPTKPSGNWIQVQFESLTGWINSTYCERK